MTASRRVRRSIEIAAGPATVFDLLADPRMHARFDGSGTVQGDIEGPERLTLGSTFRMRMHNGIPYVIRNTVVEYAENALIAWRHFAGHRWRYELEPVEGGTRVTETFDYSMTPVPAAYDVLGFPATNARGIEATLQRLKELVES